nr:retrovirus-related Pol polyprotein from transposon TNT 1-94 [Tanacetum cinerariifolium]
MDSGASFYATYCKEQLARFKLRPGKVRLANDKTLDIVGVGDTVLKTSFGTSWTLKDVRYISSLKRRLISVGKLDEEGYHVGFEDQQWKVTKGSLVVAHGNKRGSLHMVEVHPKGIDAIINGSGSADVRSRNLAENDSIVAEHGLSLEITQSPAGSSDMSEGSKNSRSFEDSGRSDENTLKMKHPTRQEAPRLHRYEDPPESTWLQETKSSIHLVKKLKFCSWAKLVRILISERSLSLLNILRMKSLAAMFTRLVMKEKLKFCVASTGLQVAQPQVNLDSAVAQVEQITSFTWSGTGGPATLEQVASCIVGGEAYCSTGFEGRIVGCKLNPTSVEYVN